MPDEPYKLNVTLPGGAAFIAEGPEGSVRADYERFLAAFSAPSSARAERPMGASGSPSDADLSAPPAPDAALLARVFQAQPNGTLGLLSLPASEHQDVDGLLLLLYGYRVLNDEMTVLADQLLASARLSGLRGVTRIDRPLAPLVGEFVTKAGYKRGSKYGLTLKGVARAQQVLHDLGV